ncbi:Hypothetical protein A7982_03301 [Minicystis rosea]|nr:Hypothetical protein A7982_03301 [Minicystis rosea]
MARRAVFMALVLSVVVVVAHLVAQAMALEAAQRTAEPYASFVPRKAERVVLVVVDSLPVRIAEDPRLMPRMTALRERGASGVLWASKLTSTLPGILGLATGMPSSLADSLRIFGSTGYARWTIFDDIHDRGESLSFNGDPMWATLFGNRRSKNHASDGRGGTDFGDNAGALRHAEEELRSASPPALTVMHISETDHVSHRYGTRDPRYHETIRRWDDALGAFVERALDGRTAVIITSDHGNDELGTHGGSADVYRRVPVWMFGQGIRPTHDVSMNGVDMPATIALLLGTRLPGGALAAPATAPLALDASEEARALLAAYEHLLAVGPSADIAAEHRAQMDTLHRLVAEGRAADAIDPAHRGIARLTLALDTPRRASVAGIAWALLIAVVAVCLCVLSCATRTAPRAWLVVGVLACEALFISRYGFAVPIKALLAQVRRGRLGPAAALGPVILVALGWILVTYRRSMGGALRDIVSRPLGAILLCFTFCSALPSLSNAGILFLCVLATSLFHARVRTSAWLALPIFTAYFALGSHVVLPRLGEAMIPRLVWALLAVAIASAWVHFGPLRVLDRVARAALLTLLLVAPFGRIPLGADEHLAARALAVVSLGALSGIAISRGAPRVVLAGYAITSAFVVAPVNALFPFALAAPVALMVYPAPGNTATWSFRATLLAFALSALSKPQDIPSVVAIAVVILAVAEHLSEMSAELAIGIAALTMTGSRQALFELFGHTDSPAPGYGFVDLDLAPGFLGSDGFDFWRATFLILAKVILASGLVIAALRIACLRPPQGLRVAAAGAALMVIDVLHTTARMNLSMGHLSDQFDKQLFSTFIHTALYLSMVLAYLALHAITWLPDRLRRPAALAG